MSGSLNTNGIRDANLIIFRYFVVAPDHALNEVAAQSFDDKFQELIGRKPTDAEGFKLQAPQNLTRGATNWAKPPVQVEGVGMFHRAQVHDTAVIVEMRYFSNKQLPQLNEALYKAVAAAKSCPSVKVGLLIEVKPFHRAAKIRRQVCGWFPKEEGFTPEDLEFEWEGLANALTDPIRGAVWTCVSTKADSPRAEEHMLGTVMKLRLGESKLDLFEKSWREVHRSGLHEAQESARREAAQGKGQNLSELEAGVLRLEAAIEALVGPIHTLSRLRHSAAVNLANLHAMIDRHVEHPHSRTKLHQGYVWPLELVVKEFDDDLARGEADLEMAKLRLEIAKDRVAVSVAKWSRVSTYVLALFAAAGVVQVIMEVLPRIGHLDTTREALTQLLTDGTFWARVAAMALLWGLAVWWIRWYERTKFLEPSDTKRSKGRKPTGDAQEVTQTPAEQGREGVAERGLTVGSGAEIERTGEQQEVKV